MKSNKISFRILALLLVLSMALSSSIFVNAIDTSAYEPNYDSIEQSTDAGTISIDVIGVMLNWSVGAYSYSKVIMMTSSGGPSVEVGGSPFYGSSTGSVGISGYMLMGATLSFSLYGSTDGINFVWLQSLIY
jgi:hypothetical protein